MITGGPDVEEIGAPANADLVIAADSGLALAHRLGLQVHVAVGDFDSAAAADVQRAADTGAEVLPLPRRKDETDLEVAILEAQRRGADRVLVVGGTGGRLDHLLANALVLASDRWRAMSVTGRFGRARVWVVRGEVVLTGTPGEIVSLIPATDRSAGVTSEGLAYPLAGVTLEAASARGLSNALITETARVSVVDGVLLAILPGEMADPEALP